METNNTNNGADMNQVQKIKALRYGVELETVGLNERQAADVIQTVTGGSVVQKFDAPTGWQVVCADGRKWAAVHDGSVRGGFGGCAEVVSPILTWDDMDTVQSIARALRAAGASVNDSCGMHVHVDGAAFKAKPKKLANLMAFASRWESVVFEAAQPKRSGVNHWCAVFAGGPAPIDTVSEFKKVRTLAKAKAAWYGSNASGGHYNPTRYHWLNIHALFDKGTIEFRIFDGTLHAGKIKANIILSLSIAAVALCRKSIRWDGAADRLNVATMLSAKLHLRGAEFESARGHLLGRNTGARRAEVA